MNDLFLNALNGRNLERPPVWLMRQAGRYLPAYQAFRQKYSLHDLFHCPDLAAEVMLQTVGILGVDAAILFSDILVIVEALGCRVDFTKQGGPVVSPLIKTKTDIEAVHIREVAECLSYVGETLSILKRSLQVPLIGFCGGPFTIAAYLLEEKPSHSVDAFKRWIEKDPVSLHFLLDKITDATLAYLDLQVEKGVDCIQVFESWAHILSPAQFEVFVEPYLQKISAHLESKKTPLLVFCKQTSLYLPSLLKCSLRGISVDASSSIGQIKTLVPRGMALQGNLDPVLLLEGSKEEVKKKTRQLLEEMRGYPGYIANLGHGILPKTPVSNVEAFIETVKSFTI